MPGSTERAGRETRWRAWLWPGAAGVLATLMLSSCATFDTSDRAPSRPRPGLEHLPDPMVRNEARSRWGNDDYVEGGRAYQILPSAAGYDRVGVASWYGLKFHGRRTSSGEAYDMYGLSAAHPTLPIPTYARVRNLGNGRETVVRINDRGPFHGARFLDLSYAAAVKLGFVEQGTARVRVTVLDAPGPDAAASSLGPAGGAGAPSAPAVDTADAKDPGGPGARYFLQAGAFSDRRWADARVAALRGLFDEERDGAVRVRRDPVDQLYRVRVGPLASRDAARRLRALMAEGGSGTESLPVIVEE